MLFFLFIIVSSTTSNLSFFYIKLYYTRNEKSLFFIYLFKNLLDIEKDIMSLVSFSYTTVFCKQVNTGYFLISFSLGNSGFLYYVDGSIHTFIWLMCVVMFWLSALSFAYCWPDGKIGSNLAGFTSLLEWRYVISSTLFLKNEITESITFDNIKDWDPRVKRYLPEFIRNNDIKAKATSVVLDLGGIVPTAVAVFGFGPLKDMKGVDGVVLWLCTFVLSLVAGLFAAWRKRYWNRLRNCQRILSEKAESTESVDKVVQAVPSHVIQ